MSANLYVGQLAGHVYHQNENIVLISDTFSSKSTKRTVFVVVASKVLINFLFVLDGDYLSTNPVPHDSCV